MLHPTLSRPAPSTPTISDIRSESLRVSWEPPIYWWSNSYVVQMRTDSRTEFGMAKKVSSNITSVVVRGLEIGKECQFRVVAKDKFGEEAFSPESEWTRIYGQGID